MRYIRADKDELAGFQREFCILYAVVAENPAGAGGDIHNLIAGMCVVFHMIIGKGEGVKSGNMEIPGRVLENIWHGKNLLSMLQSGM